MPVTPIVLLVNVIILLVIITIMVLVLRWGSVYDYNYGLPIRDVLRRRLIWLLLIMITLSLAAAVFNIVASFLGL